MSRTFRSSFTRNKLCSHTLFHPVLHRVRPQHTAESLSHTSRNSRFIHISRTVQPSFVHTTCYTVCACCNTAKQPICISRILRNFLLSTNCAAILCSQVCNKRSYLAHMLSLHHMCPQHTAESLSPTSRTSHNSSYLTNRAAIFCSHHMLHRVRPMHVAEGGGARVRYCVSMMFRGSPVPFPSRLPSPLAARLGIVCVLILFCVQLHVAEGEPARVR